MERTRRLVAAEENIEMDAYRGGDDVHYRLVPMVSGTPCLRDVNGPLHPCKSSTTVIMCC